MTLLIDRARKYMQTCPPAVSGDGGHNATIKVASDLAWGFALPDADAWELLNEYNATCQPPWTEAELRHKLNDGAKGNNKPRGHLAGKGYNEQRSEPRRKTAIAKFIPKKPSPEESSPLPKPIPNATRLLLRAAFEQGEGVRIITGTMDESGKKDRPKDEGATLSREEWLRKLDNVDGEFNRIIPPSAKRPGIYIGINPMKVGGSKDSDVTAFRHVLIEWDDISPDEQWLRIKQSNVPCTAVIFTGVRSVHAWVRVDAKTRQEYNDRVRILFERFQGLDPQNKNPGRTSRLPGVVRFGGQQELWDLNIGAESFSSWMADIEIESFGAITYPAELLSFDTKVDPNNVIGSRWLCKGSSMVLVGQSGLGKSSLSVQIAATWALGKPLWGITPIEPLKSLFVQAENDLGDLSEMLQGMVKCFPDFKATESDPDGRRKLVDSLNPNLIFIRNTCHTGQTFTENIRRLADKFRPHIIWIDPLYSFIGDDLNNQKAVSTFLRNWLNPIAEATGVIFVIVHHTAKPSSDPKSRKHWKSSDYSYAGAGSSEITNFARATCYLQTAGEDSFVLQLNKRGNRAGAMDINGNPTTKIYLRQSTEGIYWEQIEQPEDAEETDKPKFTSGRKSLVDLDDFLLNTMKGIQASESVIREKLSTLWVKARNGKKYEEPSKTAAVTRYWKSLLPKLLRDETTGLYGPKPPA